MTGYALLLIVLMLPATTHAQESIRNFLRVNEDFCTAGQPTIEQLTELRDTGTRAVLNLRTPVEHDAAAEEAAVRELGMKYFNIPVDANDIPDAQVEEFLRLTDDPANRPMFIHCASANRVGGMWLIRRVLRDGWTIERAMDEAQSIGMRAPGLREFAIRYIDRHR